MSSLKILAAAIAAASFSLAFAQGTPPRPATDPAVGAGQRSTQNTPMGVTGTPGGGGVAAQGSTAGSTAAVSAGSMGTASSTTATTSAPMRHSSAMGAGTKHKVVKHRAHRKAKADRN